MSFSSLYVSQTPKGANVIKYIPLYRAAEILLYVSQMLNSANVMCFSSLFVSQTPGSGNVICSDSFYFNGRKGRSKNKVRSPFLWYVGQTPRTASVNDLHNGMV